MKSLKTCDTVVKRKIENELEMVLEGDGEGTSEASPKIMDRCLPSRFPSFVIALGP
jgi:hypothetical protein